jgi:hypothetical protein
MDEFGGVYLDTEGHLPGLHRQIPQTAVSGASGSCNRGVEAQHRPFQGHGLGLAAVGTEF